MAYWKLIDGLSSQNVKLFLNVSSSIDIYWETFSVNLDCVYYILTLDPNSGMDTSSFLSKVNYSEPGILACFWVKNGVAACSKGTSFENSFFWLEFIIPRVGRFKSIKLMLL